MLLVWRSSAVAILVAVGFLLASLAIGRLVFRLPMLARLSPPGSSRPLFHLVAGTFAASSLLLLLLAFDKSSDPGLSAFAILCLGALLYEGIQARRDVAEALRSFSARRRAPTLIAGAAFLGWLLPFLASALLPITDWDSLMYHLPLAQRLLREGIWSTDPYVVHYNFPATAHLFYALFLKLHSPGAIPVFTLLLGGLTCLAAVYEFTRWLWGRRCALIAVLLYLSANVIWSYAATARVDNAQAVYFLLAVYAVMLFLRQPEQQGWLIIAAMAMSMNLGMKYTAGALLLVLLPVVLFAIPHAGIRRTLPAAALASVILIFPAGFWYARNWLMLGDPCYPFLSKKLLYIGRGGQLRDFFRDIDHFIERHSPGETEVTNTVRQMGAAGLLSPAKADVRKMVNVWDVMTHPRRYAPQDFVTIPHIFLLFLALPLVYRGQASWVLFYVGIAGFFALASFGHETRYLTPLLPLFAAGTAAVLLGTYSMSVARSRRLAQGILAVSALYLCGYIGVNWLVEARRLRAVEAPQYFFGRRTALDVLSRVADGQPLSAAIRYFDGGSGREGRILMLLETRCYPLTERCLGDDPTFNCHRWLAELMNSGGDDDRLAQQLRKQTIKYILVNWTVANDAKQRAMEMMPGEPTAGEVHRRRMLWAFYQLDQFLKYHGVLAYAETGLSIFELTNPPKLSGPRSGRS